MESINSATNPPNPPNPAPNPPNPAPNPEQNSNTESFKPNASVEMRHSSSADSEDQKYLNFLNQPRGPMFDMNLGGVNCFEVMEWALKQLDKAKRGERGNK